MEKERRLLEPQQDLEDADRGPHHDQEQGDRFEELRDTLARLTSEWHARAGKRAQSGSSRQHSKAGGGHDAGEDRRAPWRRDLGRMLESTAAHLFIVCLLLLDLIATIVDVLHTLHNDSRDLSRCVAMVEACQCSSSFDLSESWEFLYWIGIAVLCVLALNLLGLFVACGLSFFRHAGYLLDLVVVATALCLEIFLDTETAGLLVILNLWRIIRVAHGVFEVTDEAWEKKIHELEGRIRAAEAAHNDDIQAIHRLQAQVADLKCRPASLHDQESSY